ncbi:spore coat protein [Zongyangia hominis]|uniref:Spore coat protein n=1 Tax=Zongyangia hominis TaxID=2763677 RepID=A0A926IBY9_9FIRM|nr:spore coat protein [Zongyangia hominis]MBC8570783.1 spore coat protein [Zongyangia hominis]
MNRSDQTGMSDRDRMSDALSSQKYITTLYNAGANECEHMNYKSDVLGILNEEHQIEQEIFDDMKKRGWYEITEASPEKLDKARQKYLKK